jgi:hypothetical protein
VTAENIDYTAWRFWFDILQIGGLIALGAYSWWRDREKVTSKRFAALERQVSDRLSNTAHTSIEEKRDSDCLAHKARTTEIEMVINRVGSEIRNMPSRQEMAGLSHDITLLTSQIGRLEGRLEGLNRVADLMNEFLINRGEHR